jgi:hypothetical protein
MVDIWNNVGDHQNSPNLDSTSNLFLFACTLCVDSFALCYCLVEMESVANVGCLNIESRKSALPRASTIRPFSAGEKHKHVRVSQLLNCATRANPKRTVVAVFGQRRPSATPTSGFHSRNLVLQSTPQSSKHAECDRALLSAR